MARQLLVEAIRFDGQTQSRERINKETVAEYAEAMKLPSAGNWPPVNITERRWLSLLTHAPSWV